MSDDMKLGEIEDPTRGLKPPEDTELPYGLRAKDYWHSMDDWDISDQEKCEWLIQLAHLIKGFVDWGIGIDSVQTLLAQNFVDSFEGESDSTPADSGNMVNRNHQRNFNLQASNDAGKEME